MAVNQTSVGAIAPPNGRGCGSRTKGSIYAECGISPFGTLSIEDLLVDPPIRVDEKAMGLSSVGVKLIEVDGVYHIFDIVGEEFYPNVADFVEEARRFGVSRKLSLSKEQYAKLTWESKLVLLHRRAWVGRYGVYAANWQPAKYNPCILEIANHSLETLPIVDPNTKENNGEGLAIVPDECCAGIWWQDVVGGGRDGNADGRKFIRHMPSFEYEGFLPPEGLDYPESRGYELAIFGKFPISRLVIINDDNPERMDKVTDMTEDCQLPVEVVEE